MKEISLQESKKAEDEKKMKSLSMKVHLSMEIKKAKESLAIKKLMTFMKEKYPII